MTENCELCGRGTAQKALVPVQWQYDTVCERARCRAAARDAVVAVEHSRQATRRLAGAIGARREEQAFAVGWRSDTMAKIDVVDNEDWWANDIAKRV